MKKQLVIVLVAITVLVLAIGIFAFIAFRSFTGDSTPTQHTPGSFGGVQVGTTTAQKPIDIRNKNGTVVSVPNFLLGHEPVPTEVGNLYDVHGPVYSPDESPFAVQYSDSDSQFLIVLTTEPLGASRLEAERFLRGMLMLKDEELCALNTAIVVPPVVSEAYSQYESLGLSFCPGSIKLP